MNDQSPATIRQVGDPASPCPKCHGGRVWASSGANQFKAGCKACAKAHNAVRYVRDADAHKARAAKRRAENPDRGRQYAKEWRLRNPDKVQLYREQDYPVDELKLRAAKGRYRATVNGRARQLYDAAKLRATKYNLPVSIALDHIEAVIRQGSCQQTGLKFALEKTGRHPFAPSLDQILPGVGYTPQNAQVVCAVYNYAKNWHSHGDVITMCHALLVANGYVIRTSADIGVGDLQAAAG